MSLQDQLKDEQACIAHHQKAGDEAKYRLRKVKAEIAEAEKPKLRHLDYGADQNGHLFVIGKDHNSHDLRLIGNGAIADTTMETTRRMNKRTLYGNIEDEFNALQKDRTEISIEGCYFHWHNDGSLHGDMGLIPEEKVDEFIMGLRQMRATQQRATQNES